MVSTPPYYVFIGYIPLLKSSLGALKTARVPSQGTSIFPIFKQLYGHIVARNQIHATPFPGFATRLACIAAARRKKICGENLQCFSWQPASCLNHSSTIGTGTGEIDAKQSETTVVLYLFLYLISRGRVATVTVQCSRANK